MGKLIVISAPSGAGKTSVVKRLLKNIPNLLFSISACSRKKRGNEKDGRDYHFITLEEFKNKINKGKFLEWEEVYKNHFYGTLKLSVEKVLTKNETMIFDLDVVGGLNIKKKYPQECLAIFIMPPSIEELKIRLKNRGSESNKSLEMRINNAKEEISRSNEFDETIINDDFGVCCEKAEEIIRKFIES